jgi:EAL domain-containing protein (putative c-di-GMP-specific phosphodiesterase class I)
MRPFVLFPRIRRTPVPLAHSSDAVALHPGWRRALLVAMPFAVLAFVLGVVFELSGGGDLFDLLAYGAGIVTISLLELLLYVRPGWLGTLGSTLISSMSLFFLAKLTYLLFFSPPATDILAEMTETFFWVPVVYVLAFFIPGLRWGRFSVALFGILTPAVTAVYVLTHSRHPHAPQPGVFYALVQLNLASVVMLLLTRTFAIFQAHLTRVRSYSEVMQELAYTDTLTGIPNRRSLEAALNAALAAKVPFAVLFIDLDRFKRVNDTQGPQRGGRAAEGRGRALAGVYQARRRFSPHQRRRVRAARPGRGERGDRRTHRAKAGRRVRHPLRDGHSSAAPHREHRLLSLPARRRRRRDASQARRLRHVPGQGRRTGTASSASLPTTPVRNSCAPWKKNFRGRPKGASWRFCTSLSTAFRPDNSSRSRPCCAGITRPGVRSHRASSFRSPRKAGRSSGSGAGVLRSACQTLAAWQRAGFAHVTMAVNIAPLQLSQPTFFDEVESALLDNGLSGSDLELEITERTIFHNPEEVGRVLGRLQGRGVRIAIDDFGTGYSSLGYLRDLPLDTIKIDRSFIKDLGQPRLAPHYAFALVQAITTLAETLDLEIVAEGVETDEVARTLQRLGCHVAQGNFLPVPCPTPSCGRCSRLTTAASPAPSPGAR